MIFAFVDEDCDEYVVSTKFMVLRSNDDVIPKYLYHYLKCDSTLKNLQREAESRSGTFPQITFDAISYFSIPIPSKKPMPSTEKPIAAHMYIPQLIAQMTIVDIIISNNRSVEICDKKSKK